MSGAIDIQVAFSGGAARIFALIAAASALQKLEREGRIRITRAAGTSAGSIAAALLAADVDMTLVHAVLESFPLRRLMPDQWKIASAAKLAIGSAIWKEAGLRQFVEKLFESVPEAALKTFGTLSARRGVPVIAVRTDLNAGRPSLSTDNEPLIPFLVDSCAIPFGFRGAGSRYVDGGVVSNLPVSCLIAQQGVFGPAFSFSFHEPVRDAPGTPWDLAFRIVDVAIGNAVEEQRALIGTRAFEIATDISSFDFPRAKSDGLKYVYPLVRKEAEEHVIREIDRLTHERESKRMSADFHENYLEKAKGVNDRWAHKFSAFMSGLGEIYDSIFEQEPLKFTRYFLKVTSNCLMDDDGFDEIAYESEFYTLDRLVHCHKIRLVHSHESPISRQVEVEVFGPGNKRVKIRKLFFSRTGVDGQPTRETLLFFDPPLPPASGPYRIVAKDESRHFVDLSEVKRTSFLIAGCRRAKGNIGYGGILLNVPNAYFTRLRIAPRPNCKGAQMADDTLNAHSIHGKAGYTMVGWEAVDVPSGVYLGFDIHLVS